MRLHSSDAFEPSVSVIIPCYNALGTLERTLDALERLRPAPLEIICSDDGSSDGTLEWIRGKAQNARVPVSLVTSGGGRRGAAAARNAGARSARGLHLLFLDSDVVPEPDALEHLLQRLDPISGAVVGLYRDWSLRPGVLAHFQSALVHDVFTSVDPDDSPYLGTQCVLIRADDFIAHGGFDEAYRGATVEDFAFGCRLRAAGRRIRVAPRALVVHNHAYDLRGFLGNYHRKGRDLTHLMLQEPELRLLGSGYTQLSNQLALLAVILLVAVLVQHVLEGTSPTRAMLLPLAAPAALWARFLLRTARGSGFARAIQFFVLRLLVVMVGAAGGAIALWSEARARLGDRAQERRAPSPEG
jgi:GT2 family glycosyltransferase